MKKHIISAAVAAAFAVPAMAQVTVSGLVDVGFGQIDTGAATLANRYSGFSGGLGASNFQFSGSEDLGGGMRAGFVIRQEFASATGHKSGHPANNTVVTTANRDTLQETSVSLSGGFGNLRLGKLTPMAREANGIGRLSGNFGRIDSTRHRNIVDLDNTIAYALPAMSGITAEVAMSGKETSLAPAAATAAIFGPNGRTTSMFVGYTSGALRVGFGQLTQEQTAAVNRVQQHVGADYNLGFARVGLIYATNDPDSTVDTDKQTVTSYSLVYPMQAGVSLHVNYASYTSQAANAGASAQAFGVTKDLSKRTTLYATFTKTDNEAAAAVRHGASTVHAPTAGDDPQIIGVGVRHSF